MRKVRVKADQVRRTIALLLAAVLAGCTAKATLPAPATPTATAVLAPTRTATAVPMPTREIVDAGTTERLVSRRTGSPPAIDGQREGVWATAEPLRVPLTWGLGGTEHALDVELRALHTGDTIYLLAQWSGVPPSGEENTVFNKLTLHWRIPEPAAQRLDCSVACHTAFADGRGRFVYANAETIPQGGSEALRAAGNWDAGTWTLEWSRPLTNDNPFDLQFDDLDGAYSFLIKIFERIEGRPDPVSERHLLVFQP